MSFSFKITFGLNGFIYNEFDLDNKQFSIDLRCKGKPTTFNRNLKRFILIKILLKYVAKSIYEDLDLKKLFRFEKNFEINPKDPLKIVVLVKFDAVKLTLETWGKKRFREKFKSK